MHFEPRVRVGFHDLSCAPAVTNTSDLERRWTLWNVFCGVHVSLVVSLSAVCACVAVFIVRVTPSVGAKPADPMSRGRRCGGVRCRKTSWVVPQSGLSAHGFFLL